MNLLWKTLFLNSFFLAPAILLFLIYLKCTRRNYQPQGRYRIWNLLLFLFLVPPSFFSSLVPISQAVQAPDSLAEPIPFVETALDWLQPLPQMAHPTQPILSLGALIGFLWVVGAFVVLFKQIISYNILKKRIFRWSIPVSDSETLKRLSNCKKELEITRKVELLQNQTIFTPLMIGIFRPIIVLPTSEKPDLEQQIALTHELVHLKRNDILFQLLRFAVVAFYWFHPLVWIVYSQAEKEMEQACDQSVISGGIPAKDYAKTILSYAATGAEGHVVAAHFVKSKKETYNRVEEIMNTKQRKSVRVIFLAAIVIALIVGTFSACQGEELFLDQSSQTELPPVKLALSTAGDEQTSVELDAVGAGAQEVGELVATSDLIRAEKQYLDHGLELYGGAMAWPARGGYIGTKIEGYPGHSGIDINGTGGTGSPVYSAEAGTVIQANESDSGYGNYIILEHQGGVSTLYAHMDTLDVIVGDVVERAQPIGTVGSSGISNGPQLHFEVRVNGLVADPEDYIVQE